ncbi:MAG: NAD(P)H-dependent glycerol-3-phosphate dehydrogenase [Aquificaceae bacterium]
MEFSILGGGRWGVALSTYLGKLGHKLLVYDRNRDVLKKLNMGLHPYIEGLNLVNVEGTDSLKDLEKHSEYILLVLPVQVIREVVSLMDLSKSKVISASKGLEVKTYKRVSQVVKGIHPTARVFSLSGPSFASEVSRGLPTALVLAGDDLEEMRKIKSWFMSERFRVYLSNDLVGVELGGALKNVIAIACGISDGLSFGENARASLITRGLTEMVRIGIKMGAKKETFYGLSGMGDLFLTASSSQSRNRSFGYLLGKGASVENALKEIGQVVEGFETVKAVKNLSEELGVYAPICNAVYRIVVGEENLLDTVNSLLLRPPQMEFENL